jgi:hypothetical protein
MLALVLGSGVAVSVATGPTAHAASACPATGNSVTCTYTGAGTYSFSVPAGVTSLDVTAVGAAGGANCDCLNVDDAGGLGASVEDTSVPVSTYGTKALTVVVGGVGGTGNGNYGGSAAAGGTPGGGGAAGTGGSEDWAFSGGGGGYSGLLDPSGNALVIAGGGGGAGYFYTGGAGDTGSGGGAGGGETSSSCPNSDPEFTDSCGGGGGTSTAGGAGGAGNASSVVDGVSAGVAGSPGESLAGGQGGPDSTAELMNGGGGGGGYYGGGGGGSSGGSGAGAGGGGSSYGITGLSNEQTSTAAASVTISYQLPTVPGAPTGVSAIAGNTQISVSWTAPVSDGGSAITGYTVSAQGGGTTTTRTLDDPSATSAVIGGLVNGTAYDITVAAINSVGTGPATAASDNPVTPTASAPLIVSPDSLAVGVGQEFWFKVSAAGRPKPTITASGLPSWARFIPAVHGGSAVLFGRPPAGSGGIYKITFSASNGVGFAVTQNATLSVLGFTSAAKATFPLGQSGSFTVTTSLPSSSVALSLWGFLPPGVSFSPKSNGTATLSGVPYGQAGRYRVTLRARFGTAVTTQEFTLIITRS